MSRNIHFFISIGFLHNFIYFSFNERIKLKFCLHPTLYLLTCIMAKVSTMPSTCLNLLNEPCIANWRNSSECPFKKMNDWQCINVFSYTIRRYNIIAYCKKMLRISCEIYVTKTNYGNGNNSQTETLATGVMVLEK